MWLCRGNKNGKDVYWLHDNMVGGIGITWILCSTQDGVVWCAICTKPCDAMIDKVSWARAAIFPEHYRYTLCQSR